MFKLRVFLIYILMCFVPVELYTVFSGAKTLVKRPGQKPGQKTCKKPGKQSGQKYGPPNEKYFGEVNVRSIA